MSLTHNLDIGWSSGNGAPSNTRVSLSADGDNNYGLSVPNATVNQLVNLAIDVSQLKMLHIKSDKAITIKTNNSGDPDHTFSIAAGVPFVWYTGCGHRNPFEVASFVDPDVVYTPVDVTALYVSNASGGTATVSINVLHDATP